MRTRHKAPSFPSIATRGDGVYEALETITKLVVTNFESGIPAGQRQLSAELEAIEGGLSEALRNADQADAEPPSVIASLTVPPARGTRAPSSVPPGGARPDRGQEAPAEAAARAPSRHALPTAVAAPPP